MYVKCVSVSVYGSVYRAFGVWDIYGSFTESVDLIRSRKWEKKLTALCRIEKRRDLPK